jgi:glycine dehydrogenase subunit 2
MPELSEVDVIRHFTRISTWNYHIDLGLYPLGSCTMKYNPRLTSEWHEWMGLPCTSVHACREYPGALEIQKTLENCLAEISGMDAVTLQPAAGAHGELTGILMIRAYHEVRGNPRRRSLFRISRMARTPRAQQSQDTSCRVFPRNAAAL